MTMVKELCYWLRIDNIYSRVQILRNSQHKNMNREQYLQETFPTKDGKTYIQSLDEFNSKKEEDVKEDTCRSGGINNDADE